MYGLWLWYRIPYPPQTLGLAAVQLRSIPAGTASAPARKRECGGSSKSFYRIVRQVIYLLMVKPRTLLVVACVAGAAWIVLLLGKVSGSDGPSPGILESPTRRETTSESVSRRIEAVPIERTRFPVGATRSAGVLVEAVDSANSPIQDVEIAIVPRGRRWVAEDDWLVVGQTNGRGVCQLAMNSLRDPESVSIVCSKPGWTFACVEDVQIGESYRVVLTASPRVRFSFVDQEGLPVSGVRVWMSPQAIPVACRKVGDGIRCVAASGADSAVTFACSERDGVAEFRSLAEGKYNLLIDCGGKALVNGKALDSVDVGASGVRRDYVVADIWMCLVKVVGDRAVTARLLGDRGSFISSFATRQFLGPIERRLRRVHGDAIVKARVLAPGASPAVTLSLVTRRKGRISLPCNLVRYDEHMAPSVVDLSGYGDVWRAVEVVPKIVTADKTEIAGVPLFIRSADRKVSLTAESGNPVHLPPGEYSASIVDPMLRQAARSAGMCTIPAGDPGRSPAPLEVEVEGLWRACDIVCEAGDAVRPVECQIAVRSSRGATVFTLRGASRVRTAVPFGLCIFELHSVGYETQVMEEDVTATKTGDAVRVVFELGLR